MTLQSAFYLFLFLPAAALLYQIVPRKLRGPVLLLFSYIFFAGISGKLAAYLICLTIWTFFIGLCLEKSKKKKAELLKNAADRAEKKAIKEAGTKKERRILVPGILVLLAGLGVLKYYGFFAENVNAFLQNVVHANAMLPLVQFMLPIGISFYTMEAIGYMVDVYWDRIPAEHNIGRHALFYAFFPKLMEGPICQYNEIAEDLWKGDPLKLDNLAQGSVRIAWGLFKKIVIADRLYYLVNALYDNFEANGMHGAFIVMAAISYTVQLYLEFSGCMDIVVGSGKLFGITLPENFRQPFFSKNAGEFWRRWHISLGRWFKSYIFYPVSTSEMVKNWNKKGKKKYGKYITMLGTSAMVLFPVWICNGLWHGPHWTYIVYGLYYFVVLMLENALAPVSEKFLAKTGIKEDIWYRNLYRIAKTWIIIFFGETLFRADTVRIFFKMVGALFVDFHVADFFNGSVFNLGVGRPDLIIAFIGAAIVFALGFYQEKKGSIIVALQTKPLVWRWTVYLVLIVAVIIFGRYGSGYEEIDFIYAGF